MARKGKRKFEKNLREQEGLTRKEAREKRKVIDRTLYHADRKWNIGKKKK